MRGGKSGIVFFHRGSSWYLPYVLYQARHASPDSPVALIGQDVDVPGITTVGLDRFAGEAGISEFTRSYRHLSGNGYEYELYCYLRWFYLLHYMRESGLSAALYLDSDALLFSPLEEIQTWLGEGCGCALSVPAQSHESRYWCASGHASYWTLPELESFCAFALESYRDEQLLAQYEDKRSSYSAEGVSDMTTLYLFWRTRAAGAVNSAIRRNGAVIDHNLNLASNYEANEYVTAFDRKKVAIVDRKALIQAQGAQEPVTAHILHCQGRAKAWIPLFYQGPDFEGKRASDGEARKRRRALTLTYPARHVFRLIKRVPGQ